MTIKKKRIRSLENNLPKGILDKIIIPAIILDKNNDREKFLGMGFTERMDIGETVLPKSVGPISLFNSMGKELPDKAKPKETKYREIEWCRKQWIGGGNTERVCDFRMVPYKRWQRIFISPPSVEITISKIEDNKVYIVTPSINLMTKDKKEAVHRINLFLELCGHCEILDEKQTPIIRTTKSLNWTILPPGKKPWEKQKKILQPLLDLITDKQAKPVIQSRLEDINSLNPEFTAFGNQGFSGYVVFGFPKKDIYILESAFYGNAIYVFSENWETLSKKTKAQILNANLQINRITHSGERTNWIGELKNILNRHE